MPIYLYRCAAGHEEHVRQSMAQAEAYRQPDHPFKRLCDVCEKPMGQVMTAAMVPPSGTYSYRGR